MSPPKHIGQYHRIAVAGSGELAYQVMIDLLKEPAMIKRLVCISRKRSDREDENDVPAAAERRAVNYEDPNSLMAALSDMDVVISCLGGSGLAQPQQNLLRAAKAVGVKLFIPSDFDDPLTSPIPGSAFATKHALHNMIHELQQPYFFLYSGNFSDVLFSKTSAFFDMDGSEIYIVGDGDKKIRWTTRVDTARFLAHILTRAEDDELKNRSFQITGDSKSMNEIKQILEQTGNKKLQVKSESIEDVRRRVQQDPSPNTFLDQVRMNQATGEEKASAHEKIEDGNDLFADWHPTTVEEAIKLIYK